MILQLGGVARGLIYIHSQGVIHGDLKGVRLWWSGSCFHLTDFTVTQGQHPDRPNRPGPPRRLRTCYDYLRLFEPFTLELTHTRRHGPMDEPGAY